MAAPSIPHRRSASATLALALLPILTGPAPTRAQQPGPQVAPFIAVNAPVVALTHARVMDGSGAPTQDDRTVIIRDGRIAEVGAVGAVAVPADAEVHDLSGQTLLPGFVMLHEHLFYPAGGGGMYNELGYSFPRLYLAGGVTTARTAGSIVPYADLNLARGIEERRIPGPDLDVTGPYLNGPGLPIPAVHVLTGPADARSMVRYWADQGVTSFKAYMHISRDELAAAIDEAHQRGLKVTGHLCSVTYREAADLGIDDLEHGFLAATDFAPGKEPDICPQNGQASLLDVDLEGEEFRELVQHLVERNVAVTSTLTVFETFTPGRPPASAGALDAMAAEPRDSYLRGRAQLAVAQDSPWARLFPKAMAMEKAFAEAGGLLVVGTDPTGYGGVVAGFSNQRALELLVESGFTPEQAVRIATLNGARYLGRDGEIGTVAAGKRADLVVVDGDPSTDITAVRHVRMVFKAGIGYDSAKLVEATRGMVGLR